MAGEEKNRTGRREIRFPSFDPALKYDYGFGYFLRRERDWDALVALSASSCSML